jgi:BirA family transcriptional regulator, biotin operon repressor / biotin---[acetyl-CoA-carboxylase] ligase
MRIDERVRLSLAATTRFGDVRLLESVDSTNRYVRDAAVAGTPEGLVVSAEHQHAGRGRVGRTWEAPAGSGLLASVLLRPRDLPPARLHLLTAATGCAAVAAVRRVAGVEADLKWPNDLLIGERKLAGILAEALGVTVEGTVDAVVVGIGLNVSAAPAGAASLDEEAGRPIGRADLLVALLEELEGRYGRWDEVAAEYRAGCATVGRRVRVERPGGSFVTGVAVRVDGDGRLVVAAGDTGAEEAFSVGDVVHVRSAGEDGE